MSHIYQPVMLRKLLLSNGTASDIDIASQLLQYDNAQIEYYQKITNNMVGRVLRNRGVVTKIKNQYFLEEFNSLSNEQISELIQICEQKLDAYIQKRGDAIWNHRRLNRVAISGTVRYEVLKRAKYKCELCGISAEEKALEVDHIVPKNLGGEDSINNYQALCYSCNASKGDRDSTDFRKISDHLNSKEPTCIFCDIPKKRIIEENNLSILVKDKFPVSEGHLLVIPKRHSPDYFQLIQAEINSINQLILKGKDFLEKRDNSITGFNIGMNCGASAGQTIMHTHIHIIPRRINDIENAKGGIRNVFPGKGDYLTK